MKLKKHICIRCRERYYEMEDKIWWLLWIDEDEQNWKEGKVYCPHDDFLDVPISSIPKNCPYALEHITQEEDKDG